MITRRDPFFDKFDESFKQQQKMMRRIQYWGFRMFFIYALVIFGALGGAFYVAWHFISKVW